LEEREKREIGKILEMGGLKIMKIRDWAKKRWRAVITGRMGKVC